MPITKRPAVHAQPKRLAVPPAAHEELPGIRKEMRPAGWRFAKARRRPLELCTAWKEPRSLLHKRAALVSRRIVEWRHPSVRLHGIQEVIEHSLHFRQIIGWQQETRLWRDLHRPEKVPDGHSMVAGGQFDLRAIGVHLHV